MTGRPTDRDYQRLLELRAGLRRFLQWSESQAKAAGITPAQHQLLLAIRGHDDSRGPTIGEIADYMAVRHHSAVGLTDRAVAAGLVARRPDLEHPGSVRLWLTALGSDRQDTLAELHMEELTRLVGRVLAQAARQSGATGRNRTARLTNWTWQPPASKQPARPIRIASSPGECGSSPRSRPATRRTDVRPRRLERAPGRLRAR